MECLEGQLTNGCVAFWDDSCTCWLCTLSLIEDKSLLSMFTISFTDCNSSHTSFSSFCNLKQCIHLFSHSHCWASLETCWLSLLLTLHAAITILSTFPYIRLHTTRQCAHKLWGMLTYKLPWTGIKYSIICISALALVTRHAKCSR
jgi:hypothetical protein